MKFIHSTGAEGERLYPETFVGGTALADLDNDGDLDLLAVSGRQWSSESKAPSAAIFLNDGSAHFTDATHEWGLDYSGFGIGINAIDYDADGWLDIFVASMGENKLYRNLEGRGLEDVTDEVGVGGEPTDFSINGIALDTNNDGVDELFVLNYLNWDKDADIRTIEALVGVPRAYNGPGLFKGAPSRLYQWDGQRFNEQTKQAGIEVTNPFNDEHIGKGLGALPVDLNNDGYLDLIVANDRVRNFAFINDGKGSFSEQGEDLGLAYDNGGMATAAMGMDMGILDSSGVMSVGMGNFEAEMTSLYRQRLPGGLFFDDAAITGVGQYTRESVTFGMLFVDLDLDGHQEIVHANGHTEPDIGKAQGGRTFRQLPQVMLNCPDQCAKPFALLGSEQLGDLAIPIAGRALVSGDLDDDGDVDLLISDVDGPLRVFRNDQQHANNWLQIKLRADCRRHGATGAVVEAEHGEHRQVRYVSPFRSYASQVSPIVNLGLGKAAKIDRLRITWLGGEVTELNNVSPNQRIEVTRQPCEAS